MNHPVQNMAGLPAVRCFGDDQKTGVEKESTCHQGETRSWMQMQQVALTCASMGKVGPTYCMKVAGRHPHGHVKSGATRRIRRGTYPTPTAVYQTDRNVAALDTPRQGYPHNTS